jgi:hypothetical protein
MTKREGTPAPAGLTDGEVERLAEIGRAAWCEAESARPSRPKWIAFARAVATAVVGVGAEPHGWCERCKAHTAAAVAVSWICRQCGCEAYEVPQRQPPTPAPGGQEGEGFQRVAEAVADYDQTPDEARAELEADGVDVDAFVERVRTRATQDHDHCQQTSRELAEFAAGYKRAVTDCGSPACPHRPPPARPPDGGDREPAAPTTNPSTISSKLVDGDTTPAGGDGCVDPCDDPRCTVHPPADVAPRPPAARGGEGEGDHPPGDCGLAICPTCNDLCTRCFGDAEECAACNFTGERQHPTSVPLADLVAALGEDPTDTTAAEALQRVRELVHELAHANDVCALAETRLRVANETHDAAVAAARTEERGAVLGEVARVLNRMVTPEAFYESNDEPDAYHYPEIIDRVRAALAAHFAAHWPAGGGEG